MDIQLKDFVLESARVDMVDTQRTSTVSQYELITMLNRAMVHQEKRVYSFVKRTIDIVCAGMLFAVIAIPLLIVMLAIYMQDKGNPIFAQERIGKDGKVFRMYKLRTMVVNAEARREEIREVTDNKTLLSKSENDPRITKLGAFLRKTSIDELPQLINVIKGDMTIIGPRPLVPREHEAICEFVQRDMVKPGLSCYSVLDRRSRDRYEHWAILDYKYIQERSTIVDLKIMLKTFWVSISRNNF